MESEQRTRARDAGSPTRAGTPWAVVLVILALGIGLVVERPLEPGTISEPEPSPSESDPSPSPSESETTTPTDDGPVGSVDHGEDLTVDNTGLRGAGYVYDAGSDTFSHPEHGPLDKTGSITTSKDGQVIEGVDVAGRITVKHDNVTIRNCRVVYDGSMYAIDAGRYTTTGADTLIEHCDITHNGANAWEAFGTYVKDGTIRWSNVHRFGTGIYMGERAAVEYTKFWDPQKVDGMHGCGIMANGGNDYRIYRNNVEGNTSATICLYARDPFYGVLVQDNLMDGGTTPSYCLNAGDNKNGSGVNEDIRIMGNLFGRSGFPECGQYGPYYKWDGSRPGAAWCDNRWRDTRALIGDDSGC